MSIIIIIIIVSVCSFYHLLASHSNKHQLLALPCQQTLLLPPSPRACSSASPLPGVEPSSSPSSLSSPRELSPPPPRRQAWWWCRFGECVWEWGSRRGRQRNKSGRESSCPPQLQTPMCVCVCVCVVHILLSITLLCSTYTAQYYLIM